MNWQVAIYMKPFSRLCISSFHRQLLCETQMENKAGEVSEVARVFLFTMDNNARKSLEKATVLLGWGDSPNLAMETGQ